MSKVTSVQITDHSAEVLAAMHKQVMLGLEACGQEAEGYAKDECPVDTGRLRNSISHKVVDSEQAAYIGTNVEYAPYVEFNDKAKHPSGKAHFLRDAAVTHSDKYKSIIDAALRS